jgi:hypothetical protein
MDEPQMDEPQMDELSLPSLVWLESKCLALSSTFMKFRNNFTPKNQDSRPHALARLCLDFLG